VLTELESLDGFQDNIEPSVVLARDALLQEIVAEQPYGHTEQIYGTTVSERLGHTPIAAGWKTALTNIGDGIRLSLSNVSQHVLAVLKGTPPHREPKSGYTKMYFWWGNPHRWPARDDLPAGPRVFYRVSHPGAEANPFLDRAIKQARPEMASSIRAGVGDYIVQRFLNAGLRQL